MVVCLYLLVNNKSDSVYSSFNQGSDQVKFPVAQISQKALGQSYDYLIKIGASSFKRVGQCPLRKYQTVAGMVIYLQRAL